MNSSRMTERWPCLAARYRGATWTSSSRLARKLIVDLTLPPQAAHLWRTQGDITRDALTPGRVTSIAIQFDFLGQFRQIPDCFRTLVVVTFAYRTHNQSETARELPAQALRRKLTRRFWRMRG